MVQNSNVCYLDFHCNLILANGKEASNSDAPEAPAVEGEDTMKNLRKTFAGIFGDLQ